MVRPGSGESMFGESLCMEQQSILYCYIVIVRARPGSALEAWARLWRVQALQIVSRTLRPNLLSCSSVLFLLIS